MIYIHTSTGFSGIANTVPFQVSVDHPNFEAITDAIRNDREDLIHDLINRSTQLKKAPGMVHNRVTVDEDAGTVMVDGNPVVDVLVERIFDLLEDGFDIQPMLHFIDNLYQNPSMQTIERIFDWLLAGEMPITEDGCFIAFKRVNYDYTSFHDGRTMHTVGQMTSLPRYLCDDNNKATCSSGLHFCSQSYLPSYYGNNGRMLVLRINPKDVVSIPVEYGTAKGRACAYFVDSELDTDSAARVQVETSNPLKAAAISNDDLKTVCTATPDYVCGYKAGRADYKQYKDQFKASSAYFDASDPNHVTEYRKGFLAGHKDARGHKTNLFK